MLSPEGMTLSNATVGFVELTRKPHRCEVISSNGSPAPFILQDAGRLNPTPVQGFAFHEGGKLRNLVAFPGKETVAASLPRNPLANGPTDTQGGAG